MLDSAEDEPLGRTVQGRHVIPRVGVQSSIDSRRFISISRYSSHSDPANGVA